MSKAVEVFLEIIRRKLRDLNLSDSLWDGKSQTLKKSASLDNWRKDLDGILNGQIDLEMSDALCDGCNNLSQPFIIAFVENGPENHQTHGKIKHLCELKLGVQSCYVNLSTLEKIHQRNTDNGIDRYACSLLRKMFAKLGNGRHDGDPHHTTVTPIPNATLLMGAHVAAVSVGPMAMTEQGVNDGCQTYCITLSSKPVSSKGTYKITTMLKRAYSPVSFQRPTSIRGIL